MMKPELCLNYLLEINNKNNKLLKMLKRLYLLISVLYILIKKAVILLIKCFKKAISVILFYFRNGYI